jgi:FkbM family methyltransferase
MNYFIDLGAYKGGTIRAFHASSLYRPCTKIYAWECNPQLEKVSYGPGVVVIRSAAWINNGHIDLYTSPKITQGSSVDITKTTGDLDKKRPAKVPCIDFPEWLSCECKYSDHVILKMNIEGAEYAVLDRMLENETINIVDILIVRWHWNKLTTVTKIQHDALKKRLKLIDGLQIYQDYTCLKE